MKPPGKRIKQKKEDFAKTKIIFYNGPVVLAFLVYCPTIFYLISRTYNHFASSIVLVFNFLSLIVLTFSLRSHGFGSSPS